MNERKEVTCVIIGGGYAGINALKAMRPYHLRKVLLFKPAVKENDIVVPFGRLFPDGVEFIQGTVTNIEKRDKRLLYQDESGNEQNLKYDILILAAGSIIRQPSPEQGGIALTGLDSAARIREAWLENLRKAVNETSRVERMKWMTIAVAGAGISGIETSAELVYALREEARRLGLDPSEVIIYLLNAQHKLFQEGPARVGMKLERLLTGSGVTVLHGRKAICEREGELTLSDGKLLKVGLCVWTLGLLPNPMLKSMGLPLTAEGRVIVDANYRVKEAPGIYSIGDCARIVDPVSGLEDGMTCKEATAQADRLGKIVTADLMGHSAPAHKKYIDFFCFGLGPERGMVWTRQWGLDIIITGKLGWKVRKMTWDYASLLK
jgi:NADH dehydrogenase